jgi:hypothetical protein
VARAWVYRRRRTRRSIVRSIFRFHQEVFEQERHERQ